MPNECPSIQRSRTRTKTGYQTNIPLQFKCTESSTSASMSTEGRMYFVTALDRRGL